MFCGAGISIGAGFPTFSGLVQDVYRELNEVPSALETVAIEGKQFDRALGLLETRVEAPRVRDAVRSVLGEPTRSDFPVHEALLRLATDQYRERSPRLVTTNFDNLFKRAANANNVKIVQDLAPALPVPKPAEWHSIVYLHGALEPPERERLVYTSADFGRAYMTEGWATRFLTTLCHYYTVLFVGYSLEDPVLRYIMDALATERATGGPVQPAYVLAHYEVRSEQKAKQVEWEAKGVKPLLYFAPGNDHRRLEETLVEWAKRWDGGLQSKSQLAVDYGLREPTTLTYEDRSQFEWALQNEVAFTEFRELGKRAPVSWFGKLFELFKQRAKDLELLGCWAASHVDEPALMRKYYELLDSPVNSPERHALKGLRLGISSALQKRNGIADSQREKWLFLLQCQPEGAVAPGPREPASFLESPFLRFKKLLSIRPCPELWPTLDGEIALSCRIRFDGGQRAFQMRRAFDELSDSQRAELAFLLTDLLREGVEYQRLVGSARAGSDWSAVVHPSIRPSNQNSDDDWGMLIDFARSSAEALDRIDAARIRGLASMWLSLESPLFDRLALHIVGSSRNWTAREKMELLR